MPFDSTPVNNPVVDRLRMARGRIEEHWCKSAFVKGAGIHRTYCSLGAIWCNEADDQNTIYGVCYDTRPYADIAKAAVTTLRMAIGCAKDDDIAYWNDHSGRTKGDVLAAFDSAILHAERDALVGETADAV